MSESAKAPTGSLSPMLEIDDLVVEYPGRHGASIRAVDGVSLTVAPRETLGLVGESGSGKSTIARAVLGLTPVASGSITFEGNDITRADAGLRRALSAYLQVVFQDPYSSLNPARTVGQTLAETLSVHEQVSSSQASERVGSMLEQVGLPATAAERYPAHFSGGQRQRIAIARALMVGPRLVICDEAVSALDVSIQAQVLNLLSELQEAYGQSYLFIGHDLAVVRHVSHRLVVLYRGAVMETGDVDAVYESPKHPYTQVLLEAAPLPSAEQHRRRQARGLAPSEVLTPGADSCPFVVRCPHATEICRTRRPELEPTPRGGLVACHRWREIEDAPAPLAAPTVQQPR